MAVRPKPFQPGFTGQIGNQFVGGSLLDPRGFYNIPDYGAKGQSLHLYPNNKKMLIKAAAAPRPPTSAVPGAAGGAAGASAPSAPADPRDAQYFTDVAKLNQYYGNTAAGLESQRNELTRQFTSANTDLDVQQPKDTLAAKVSANKSGLFYSGTLGKNLGEIESNYAKRRTDLQGAYNTNIAGIDRQKSDLEANYAPLDPNTNQPGLLWNDALLSGVSRSSDRDITSGILNALKPQPMTKAIASAGRPTKTSATGKKVYQRADGKWIPF